MFGAGVMLICIGYFIKYSFAKGDNIAPVHMAFAMMVVPTIIRMPARLARLSEGEGGLILTILLSAALLAALCIGRMGIHGKSLLGVNVMGFLAVFWLLSCFGRIFQITPPVSRRKEKQNMWIRVAMMVVIALVLISIVYMVTRQRNLLSVGKVRRAGTESDRVLSMDETETYIPLSKSAWNPPKLVGAPVRGSRKAVIPSPELPMGGGAGGSSVQPPNLNKGGETGSSGTNSPHGGGTIPPKDLLFANPPAPQPDPNALGGDDGLGASVPDDNPTTPPQNLLSGGSGAGDDAGTKVLVSNKSPGTPAATPPGPSADAGGKTTNGPG